MAETSAVRGMVSIYSSRNGCRTAFLLRLVKLYTRKTCGRLSGEEVGREGGRKGNTVVEVVVGGVNVISTSCFPRFPMYSRLCQALPSTDLYLQE